jgi:predicted DNA-binding transcriptional regulator YafY
MKYATASRRSVGERHASVHLVDVGPPARFIATCHRHGDLRWFRVDGIFHARPDERERFRDSAPGAVEAFRAASLDGFKGDGPVAEHSFVVREPEASWVANNLLEGMRVESRGEGIRVTIETSAVQRLARYVVSLGGAARPESLSLADAVVELARGALEQATAAVGSDERPAISDVGRDQPARPRSDV